MRRSSIELQPFTSLPSEFDAIERRIRTVFKKVLYDPLMLELDLPRRVLENAIGTARSILLDAIAEGKVTFYRGAFRGTFNAAITKELRNLGAKWDPKGPSFHLTMDKLPADVQAAVRASDINFQMKMARIDQRLMRVQPEDLTDKIQLRNMFDATLWRTEKSIDATLKGISVPPQLTPERRQRIADEWQNNMDLWIQNFAEKEIVELREAMKANVYAGNRHEAMIKTIQKSYGITLNKAKFLARQETKLLVTKFKEVRYTEAGIEEYRWACVVGSKLHPVRPAHKKLDGKIFRFDSPPITSEPGTPERRNNAGADYNCRCNSIPRVNFRKN